MDGVRTVRPTSARGVVVSLLLLGACCAVGVALARRPEVGIIAGAAVFLAWRIFVREVVCRHHRRGIRLTQAKDFRGGLAAFQASEAWWKDHPTLDQYRWALLGSSGPYGFLVLARYNQAYCLSRLARVKDALATLEGVLTEAPNMEPARELLAQLQASTPQGDATWHDHAESTWVFDDPAQDRKPEDS